MTLDDAVNIATEDSVDNVTYYYLKDDLFKATEDAIEYFTLQFVNHATADFILETTGHCTKTPIWIDIMRTL